VRALSGARALSVARKEVRHIHRDPFTLAMAVGVPVLLVVFFGYVLDFDVRDIRLRIVDRDNTPASRALAAVFTASGYFRPHGPPAVPAARLLEEGRVKAALFIEPGFAEDVARGAPARAQVVIDGADNQTAGVIAGYLDGVATIASRRLGVDPPVDLLRTRFLFNNELNSRWFVVTGLFVVVMGVLSILMTALTVAREWETGSMELLLSTPVRPLEMIVGKLAPYLALCLAGAGLIHAAARLLFHVPFRGSLWFFSGGQHSVPVLHLGPGSIDFGAHAATATGHAVLKPHGAVARVADVRFYLPGRKHARVFPGSHLGPAGPALYGIVPGDHFEGRGTVGVGAARALAGGSGGGPRRFGQSQVQTGPRTVNATLVGFVRKEFRQALRDKRMRVVIFVIPVVQMTLFGLALSNEVKNVRLSVQSPPSDRLMGDLRNAALGSGWFHAAPDRGDPVRLLETGQADAVLVAPGGGSTRARERGDGRAQLLIDGTNAIRARAIDGYVHALARRAQGETPPPAVALDVRTLYNPTLTTAVYLVPGVMGLILGLITILLTSMSLAREREMGTLETLLAAPVPRWEIFVGKTLPFVLLGLADVPLLAGFAHVVFGVPVRGPLWALALNAGAFVVTMVAAGTLISTFAKNQQQAMMGGFLFLFPAIQLSGVMAPVENFPLWAKPLAWLNPIQYFVSLNRQVMLRGAVGPLFWSEWAALCALGAVIALWAAARLNRHTA
jgi:ABC-2 type transport system permease protein